MSDLKLRLANAVKDAMRAKASERLSTLRFLQAAIKQREVDERVVVDDAGVVSIVEKLIKQRKDSIEQFQKAGRTDLVDIEMLEQTILQAYLPAQLSLDEVTAIVKATIAQLGANSPQEMGKVIGILKPQLAGKADMGAVSAMVKAALNPS